MNIPGLSTSGLVMMHGAIKQALAVDDNLPPDQNKPYGVRTFADWKQMADAIEAELRTRSVKFDPAPW